MNPHPVPAKIVDSSSDFLGVQPNFSRVLRLEATRAPPHPQPARTLPIASCLPSRSCEETRTAERARRLPVLSRVWQQKPRGRTREAPIIFEPPVYTA